MPFTHFAFGKNLGYLHLVDMYKRKRKYSTQVPTKQNIPDSTPYLTDDSRECTEQRAQKAGLDTKPDWHEDRPADTETKTATPGLQAVLVFHMCKMTVTATNNCTHEKRRANRPVVFFLPNPQLYLSYSTLSATHAWTLEIGLQIERCRQVSRAWSVQKRRGSGLTPMKRQEPSSKADADAGRKLAAQSSVLLFFLPTAAAGFPGCRR